MRIVVAPDKFKGTLSAREAARAIAVGARDARPDADVTIVPLADGGDGSLFAIVAGTGGEVRPVRARDPLGRPLDAPLGYLPDGRVFVESATASGLALVGDPSPLVASTHGTGDLIVAAARRSGAPKIVVGVGGTASTDGGTGAAAAAGWRFLDALGRELAPGGAALGALAAVDGSNVDPVVARCDVVGACDVRNALIGSRGAARAFAPQKGASRTEVRLLEAGLERLVEIVRRDVGVDVASLAGAGAGGGLGGGLVAFFGARLESGFETIARAVGLPAAVAGADLVLTGEGRVDESSLEGKVVGGVAAIAREHGVECVVVGGEMVLEAAGAALGITRALSLVDECGRGDALRRTAECLRRVVAAHLGA